MGTQQNNEDGAEGKAAEQAFAKATREITEKLTEADLRSGIRSGSVHAEIQGDRQARSVLNRTDEVARRLAQIDERVAAVECRQEPH